MDCSPPGSSVHGIYQAIMEWVAISFSRGSSQPRDLTQVSRIAGRCFNLCITREAFDPVILYFVSCLMMHLILLCTFYFYLPSVYIIGKGNGSPLQCSCLENPRDGGACWAAVCGVAQSWTRLTRLSSSSAYIIQTEKSRYAVINLENPGDLMV